MDRQQFWDILKRTEDYERGERFAVLVKELSRLPPDEILSFRRHYDSLMTAAYKIDLWGAAYLINGGCSDDGFNDFLSWLVSRGQRIYEAALADPDNLADVLNGDWAIGSALECAAARAWEAKTGRSDSDFYDTLGRIGATEGGDEGEDWDFDDDDEVRRRFPRLAAIYLESSTE